MCTFCCLRQGGWRGEGREGDKDKVPGDVARGAAGLDSYYLADVRAVNIQYIHSLDVLQTKMHVEMPRKYHTHIHNYQINRFDVCVCEFECKKDLSSGSGDGDGNVNGSSSNAKIHFHHLDYPFILKRVKQIAFKISTHKRQTHVYLIRRVCDAI